MSRALPDSLLPGESMGVGEYLQSANGLYRLYLEPPGYLGLYAYTINTAVRARAGLYNLPTRMWGEAAVSGPAVSLHFPNKGGIELHGAGGVVIWRNGGSNVFANHRFLLQDDGNLVHYLELLGAGGYRVSWATGTNEWASMLLPRSYPPETATATITVGTVAIDSDGNGEFVNETDRVVGVRDNHTYVGVPPGGRQPLGTQAGQIAISSEGYNFLQLCGPISLPSGASQSGSADAQQSYGSLQRSTSGGRVTITMAPGFGLAGGETETRSPFVPFRFPEEVDELESLRRR